MQTDLNNHYMTQRPIISFPWSTPLSFSNKGIKSLYYLLKPKQQHKNDIY